MNVCNMCKLYVIPECTMCCNRNNKVMFSQCHFFITSKAAAFNWSYADHQTTADPQILVCIV